MLKNYLHVAWRSIVKNPLASFINIFGLAMAIGCGMVAFVFVEWNMNMNEVHEKRETVFMATTLMKQNNEDQAFAVSPIALGPALQQDFPQVLNFARLIGRSGTMRYEDQVFNEYIWFTDPAYLEMFTFPLKWGNAAALKEKDQIVLSEDLATKYFGTANPVGKTISLRFDDKTTLSFIVGAVVEKFSDRTSIKFDALSNLEVLRSVDPTLRLEDWSKMTSATFIELNTPKDAAAIENGMNGYVERFNAAQEEWEARSYKFEPLATLYEAGNYIRWSIAGSSDPTGRIVLAIMAAILILLACLNYINIAVANASKRLKEIGVRKVIGANQSSVIVQFLMENALITLFALLLGFGLAVTLLVPGFDRLFSIGFEFKFDNLKLWIFLILLLTTLSIVSGFYPAIVVSRFKPVSIFRGKLKLGGKSIFTKVFLTLQFTLSMIAIVGAIAFVQNSKWNQNKDWGYNHKQRISIEVPNFAAFEQLKNEMAQYPDVLSMAGSAHHIGRHSENNRIEFPDQKLEVQRLDASPEYFETMGLRLKEGRTLDENIQADKQAVIVNETLVEKMGWPQALGKEFRLDSLQYSVIGVVQDFHYYSFWNMIEPLIIKLAPEDEYRFLTMEVREGKATQTYAYAEQAWKKLFPNDAYRGSFQDETFQDYFEQSRGHGKLMTFAAILTIVLSCMGLFGLVSLNVAARMKEFSIRKVLGAGVPEMIRQVNRQFLLVLIIATMLGIPASYFAIGALLEVAYIYHMPLNMTLVVLGAILLLVTAVLTVSSQIRKVLISNPVNGLRDE
ncbi:MAG: FtsX-like permease family protein [Saprospiraceae bacterium]|nr:FtsX-like permease family protein [Saprospiraceae bacterium]